MILVTYTRKFVNALQPQGEYKWFETIEEFIDWLKEQGTLAFSLSKGGRSFTQHGWVKRIQSPAQTLQTMDTNLQMVIKVNRIVSDEGILFEDVQHCSEKIVDCMALKCLIQAADKNI